MADRFALGDGPAGQVQGAGFAVQGTGGAAVGAAGLFAQDLGLLFQQGGEGALGEASGRGAGELFHGLEIGVQAGAVVAVGPAGHDFAPASGEITDFSEEFGGKFTTRHSWYRLVLAAEGGGNSSALYTTHDSALQSCGWPPLRKKMRGYASSPR